MIVYCRFKAEREFDLSPAELFDYVAITNPSPDTVSHKAKLQKSLKAGYPLLCAYGSGFILYSYYCSPQKLFRRLIR